jgi:hypothetical protein
MIETHGSDLAAASIDQGNHFYHDFVGRGMLQ